MTEPEGVRLPCYCPHCGLVFPDSIIFLGMAKGVHAKEAPRTCPRCSAAAHLVPGVFGIGRGSLRLLEGPGFSVDMLRRLKGAADQASRGEISMEALERAAEMLSPEAAAVVREASRSGWSATTVALLAALALQQCGTEVKIDATVDLNKLYEQVTGGGR